LAAISSSEAADTVGTVDTTSSTEEAHNRYLRVNEVELNISPKSVIIPELASRK